MSPRPPDTAPAEWSVYRSVLDRMDGPARVAAAVELSEAALELRLAGIRSRHPGLSPREIVARMVLEDHGVRLPAAE